MFRGVHHVGVVVADMDRADAFLRDTLGLPLVRSLDVDGRPDRSRFYRCGGSDIELIQVIDPAQQARRLGVDAAARIEHIALEVADLELVLRQLRAAGVEVSAQVQLGNTTNAWTNPATSAGIMFQLVETRRETVSPSVDSDGVASAAVVPARRASP